MSHSQANRIVGTALIEQCSTVLFVCPFHQAHEPTSSVNDSRSPVKGGKGS